MQLAPEVHARGATEADLPALIECDMRAQADEARRTTLRSWCEQGHVSLAEAEGIVLGFLVLEHTLFGHGFIPLLCVRPSARRGGVARLLLANAERLCQTAKLFTSANASNFAAQALLLSAGFVHSGRIENLDAGDPELVFYKPLSEHEA